MAISESQKKAIGEVILAVLPDDPHPWYRVSNREVFTLKIIMGLFR